ncbi:MAG TPA: recombination-associated protein RdgC [Cellvibrionaceae bacterium]|nr:recombination-associated protein RdgC [Cellvibrionaceae bacterium]HMW73210.1 recombination-associated protein RdgC [Cellvibrionaceae bacterium]HMY38794.1 recombination-associated protein RdgC [Marinagarivorans sp.]HNG59899.1 recombination-associated protein RdgC [Cellvibrionaceae bacterium]
MWFKNLRIYTLSSPFTLKPEALSQALEAQAFKPCGNLDPMRYGFVPPLGRHGVELVHVTNGNIMVCAKKQEKIVPGGVVKDALEEKISEIKAQGRSVGRKERQELKDEILFSLLPRAFSRTRLDFAYFDVQKHWLVVNAASAKRAEELIQALRLALGTLPCVPLAAEINPVLQMSQWLGQGFADAPFVLGEECELNAPKDGRVVRVKKQDLSADEIRNHLTVGLRVQKMALHWKDAISFVLDEQLAVKRLKFNDVLSEQADDRRAESAAEEFDASFAIMALAVRDFIAELLAALGGQAPVDQL